MKKAARDKFAIAFAALKETPTVGTYLTLCDSAPECDCPPKVRLVFPRFREDTADMEAFAEYLWLQAINYVIPLRKRKDASKTTAESPTGADMSGSTKLLREAKRAFIEYRKEHPERASEAGELLAYLLALEYLGAAQIASKMALKTNGNMPVHGLDGVHARFEDGLMTLYFLESKLAATANDGAREYAESVAGFGSNRKQYLLEYEIISDLSNLSALEPAARASALEYLDVYGSKKCQRLERSVGVICYTEHKHFANKLQKDDKRPPAAHEDHFKQNFSTEHQHHRNAAIKHLNKNGVSPDECRLFFVAVPDVDEFRKLFYEVMNG